VNSVVVLLVSMTLLACVQAEDVTEEQWQKYSDIFDDRIAHDQKSWDAKLYLEAEKEIKEAEETLQKLKRANDRQRLLRAVTTLEKETLVRGHKVNLIKTLIRMGIYTGQVITDAAGLAGPGATGVRKVAESGKMVSGFKEGISVVWGLTPDEAKKAAGELGGEIGISIVTATDKQEALANIAKNVKDYTQTQLYGEITLSQDELDILTQEVKAIKASDAAFEKSIQISRDNLKEMRAQWRRIEEKKREQNIILEKEKKRITEEWAWKAQQEILEANRKAALALEKKEERDEKDGSTSEDQGNTQVSGGNAEDSPVPQTATEDVTHGPVGRAPDTPGVHTTPGSKAVAEYDAQQSAATPVTHDDIGTNSDSVETLESLLDTSASEDRLARLMESEAAPSEQQSERTRMARMRIAQAQKQAREFIADTRNKARLARQAEAKREEERREQSARQQSELATSADSSGPGYLYCIKADYDIASGKNIYKVERRLQQEVLSNPSSFMHYEEICDTPADAEEALAKINREGGSWEKMAAGLQADSRAGSSQASASRPRQQSSGTRTAEKKRFKRVVPLKSGRIKILTPGYYEAVAFYLKDGEYRAVSKHYKVESPPPTEDEWYWSKGAVPVAFALTYEEVAAIVTSIGRKLGHIPPAISPGRDYRAEYE